MAPPNAEPQTKSPQQGTPGKGKFKQQQDHHITIANCDQSN